MTALCRNCQARPARGGRRRCGACDRWYYAHGRTERPGGRTAPVAAVPVRETRCSNCAARPRAYGSVRCGPCKRWYYEHGHRERPTDLPYRPRVPRVPRGAPCVNCGQPRQYASVRCAPCTRWYYHHGHTERPGALWARRPRATDPCQDCGVRPTELHYGARSRRGLTRGRCPACYMRWWRAQRAPRAA